MKHLRYISNWVKTRENGLVWVTLAFMIGCAVLLRFFELSENSLWLDEAVAADNARRSFAELIWKTRYRNSSPILYPVILFTIQKWHSSEFSVRFVPALCSVLTIVAMLSLLPRFGVEKRVAWLTGLMATLSTAAIMHARDAREYSVDAFLVVLLIAGLLAFLKNNKRALFCTSLFLAPLLQYNLVLFGIAVLGTASIHIVAGFMSKTHDNTGVNDNQRPKLSGLLWPIVCFGAGCAITAIITLRFHWRPDGFASATYLNPYYYLDDIYRWSDVMHFIGTRTWQLFDYHLPSFALLFGVIAVGLHLAISIMERKVDALMTLFLLALALAVAAAVVRVYPLGPIRQCLYLGPIVMIAVAQAWVRIIDRGFRVSLPPWSRPVSLVLITTLVCGGGIVDLLNTNLYEDRQPVKNIVAILEERAKPDDVVFVSYAATPAVQFHSTRDLNYHFGSFQHSFDDCFYQVWDLWTEHEPTTLWLVDAHYPICQGWDVLKLFDAHTQVERLFYHPATQLHWATRPAPVSGESTANEGRIRDPRTALVDLLRGLEADVAGDRFEIFFHNGVLIVSILQCVRQDSATAVRVESYAVGSNQPNHVGYFSFLEYGLRLDDECVAVYSLTESELLRIKIFVSDLSDPGRGEIWNGEFSVNTAAVDGKPARGE